MFAVVHTMQGSQQWYLPVGSMVAVSMPDVGHDLLIHSYHRPQTSLVGCFGWLCDWSHHGHLHSESLKPQFKECEKLFLKHSMNDYSQKWFVS
jgi:hypothetical protein